jgi:hypothetical protein
VILLTIKWAEEKSTIKLQMLILDFIVVSLIQMHCFRRVIVPFGYTRGWNRILQSLVYNEQSGGLGDLRFGE